MTKTFYPFLIIVLSIFILLCAPALFSEGMFMDGLMYATVAKNLAHGEGSFWFLKFSDTFLTSFHEHPPLIFGLQSVCFRIFGDSFLVERFFSFFTYIISGVFVMLIFKEITPTKMYSLSWLPLLLWIVMPLATWGAVNNMLENGMLVFILLSVLFFLKSLKNNRFLFLALSSLMLFAAFLSKGFTGLFSLSLPFWFWCFDKEYSFKKALIDTISLLVFLALFFLLLFALQKDSLASLQAYYDIQVVNSLKNVVTVNSRFFILGKLVTEVLISLGILLLIFLLGRKQKTLSIDLKGVLIFLAIGSSAVLPITLSLKQNAHYLLCALPFFAIAFGLLIAPYLLVLREKVKWNNRILFTVAILFFITASSIAYAQKGKYCRDEKMIHDVEEIAKILPPHSVCNVEVNEFTNWALQAYMYRYASVNLSVDSTKYSKYKLVKKGVEVPSEYIQIPISTWEYAFLMKK